MRLPLSRGTGAQTEASLPVPALQGSSLRLTLKSYFRPQPKSATANYTANNGEGACSSRLETLYRQRARLTFHWGRARRSGRGKPGSGVGRLSALRPRTAPSPRAPTAGAAPELRKPGGRTPGTRRRGRRDPLASGPARRALPGGEGGGAPVVEETLERRDRRAAVGLGLALLPPRRCRNRGPSSHAPLPIPVSP